MHNMKQMEFFTLGTLTEISAWDGAVGGGGGQEG